MDRGAWWAIVHGVAKSQTRPVTNTHTVFVLCSGIIRDAAGDERYPGLELQFHR